MINIVEEKERELTAQDCYDILVLATNETLNECGFLSSYMFSHIVYVAAVKMLFEEFELDTENGWLELWNACIENGFLEEALNDYPEDFKFLAQEAEVWLNEYTAYANSARSAMDGISMVIQNTVSGLKDISTDGNLLDIVNTAKEWGMTPTK